MNEAETELSAKEVKGRAVFARLGLVLGVSTFFINPLVVGRVFRLDPDVRLYLLSIDLMLLLLIAWSVAYARTGRRSYRTAFLVSLLSVPVVLTASELALSLWRLRHVDEWRTERIDDVHEGHPTLGWRPRPSSKGRHVSEGSFDVTYDIDAAARKAIPQIFEDGPTLHVFGDSFTFGHGVRNEDTALNILARGFARERGFNVANYAVMGYGLEQMHTRLEANRGRIRPGDYVLFTPMSFDLMRNMIDKRFLCRFPVRKRTPIDLVSMRVNERWEAVDLFEACDPMENRFLQANFLFGSIFHSIRDQILRPELLENADAILAEARTLTEAAGAELVIVFLAAPWECEKNQLDFDLRGLRAEHSSMLEHCPDFEMRFPTDSHWTPAAHQWVAGFLARGLDLASASEAQRLAEGRAE